MEIPKSINIYGKKYKVKIKKGLKDDEGNSLSGLCQYDEAIISLDKDLTGDELMQTFLHECGHAVHDRMGIDQTGIPDDVKEILVDSMATFLVERFNMRLK